MDLFLQISILTNLETKKIHLKLKEQTHLGPKKIIYP